MLIPWKDSQQAVAVDPASLSSEKLLSLGSWIDAKAFGKELHELCDPYRTRFVGTTGNADMSQEIQGKFQKLGLKTWMEPIAGAPGVKHYVNRSHPYLGGNVVGFLQGTDLAHEVVIVGAHYDSVNWEKTGGTSPGVDDNGSGSAAVQLVAKAMARAGIKPRRSMMFVGFNAEEEGLVGSEVMANNVPTGKYGDIKAALIADEVAYPGRGAGERKAIFETVGDVPGTTPLVDTFAHSALLQQGDGVNGFEVNLHGFGSDHISFLNKKIPALLLIERNNIAHSDTWGHSERDGYEHVDFDYGAAMSRLLFRAAATLASPANVPLNVKNVSRHYNGDLL
jgi:acetylornithine deacetylase/succinyl-diaminopimelate desuccinylase-like protein